MQHSHLVRRTLRTSPYNTGKKAMRLVLAVIIAYSILAANHISAQSNMVKAVQLNLDNGVAVSGYDVVAYFNAGKAVKGSNTFSAAYNGAAYHFSSAQNLDAFKKDPQKYLPQYGGWCAYAMGAKGEKVEVNPETFKITGGKLYLFYNKYFTNTLNSWNKDEINLKTKADQNWKKLSM